MKIPIHKTEEVEVTTNADAVAIIKAVIFNQGVVFTADQVGTAFIVSESYDIPTGTVAILTRAEGSAGRAKWLNRHGDVIDSYVNSNELRLATEEDLTAPFVTRD